VFNNHLYLTSTGSTQVGNTEPCSDTKKERPETTTGPLSSLSDPDLLHTYSPSIFLTLGLSTDSCICTLRAINTQHTTTEQTTQDSISSLPSFTRTDTSRKHPCYTADYLHSESTSSFFLLTSSQNSRPSSHRLVFLSLQVSAATTWLELPGAMEKRKKKKRHSAKIAQLSIVHPCVHKKFSPSLLYRSLDPPQNHPPPSSSNRLIFLSQHLLIVSSTSPGFLQKLLLHPLVSSIRHQCNAASTPSIAPSPPNNLILPDRPPSSMQPMHTHLS
jgi:hypothetical protein